MQSEISKQIKVICQEKELDEETVLSAIEKALASAYRKDFGEDDQNIKFNFDPEKRSGRRHQGRGTGTLSGKV
ncbi:MAG: hypothetical protein BRC22_01515 [Parcubacteria group bacterium QH_9_35_7]|nr:MAG: hypothetical protein BRC22_01515 [Parcubacteria group bacterium QH_9_35_7]